MDPLSSRSLTRSIGEFVIGAADQDARALGASLTGNADTIKGFRVLAGGGVFAYVCGKTGKVCQIGNVVALAVGDEITPEWGISVASINGTGNAVPSGTMSIRGAW